MSLFKELKERNVFRVALAYIVAAWILLQVADVVLNNITAPDWVFQAILLLVSLGFPFALIFSWAFELTPEGLKKERDVDRSQSIRSETGRKLNAIFMGLLIIAVAGFAADKYVIGTDRGLVTNDSLSSEASRPDSSHSIAVLPFVNMSSDPEQDYFSDGISEEILNVLAQLPNLRVAARTSSFQFKGQNEDVGKIAKSLKVANVLEGSVRKSGTRLRITAQLIKASDGYHLWSETYDRDIDDIFAIQDEIALAIGEALKVELKLDAAGKAKKPRVIEANNSQAYDAFLRGRGLIYLRNRESLEEAVRQLELSLRLDPDYAPAHAQLAIATILLQDDQASYGDLTLQEVRRRAIPHLERALELAPDLADAYAGMGLLAMSNGDHSSVIEYTNKALALNPSNIDAMNWQYLTLGFLGRYEEEMSLLKKMIATDPLNIIANSNYVAPLVARNDIDAARRVGDQLMELSKWHGYTTRAYIAEALGETAEAIRWGLVAYADQPLDTRSNRALMRRLCVVGSYDEARRIAQNIVYLVDACEGSYQTAIEATQEKLASDPDNLSVLMEAANALYMDRRFVDATRVYNQMFAVTGHGTEPDGSLEASVLVDIAYARLQAGDSKGAANAMKLARQNLEGMRKASLDSALLHTSAALVAAYDGDNNATLRALGIAIDRGGRDATTFRDPVFNKLQSDEGFIALRDRVTALNAVEARKVLQLMCFDNPIPHAWQPLEATCKGASKETI